MKTGRNSSLLEGEILDNLNVTRLFNPQGNDEAVNRAIIGGNATGIANLNNVKYKWASSLFNTMLNNHWIPQKVDLTPDKQTIKACTDDEMFATEHTLSFLIALDSMQTAALPHLGNYVTAPEVKNCFTLQEFQECIHSQAYQYGLQELFSFTDRERIYNLWRDNPTLLKRNQTIADLYHAFVDKPTLSSFKKAICADFALEGIYFYNGFRYFNGLAYQGKLVEWNKNITYIEKDENTHLAFMIHLIKDLNFTSSDMDMLVDVIKRATEQEIEWSCEVYGNRILGRSEVQSEMYTKYLANQRAKAVGLPEIYGGYSVNPYAFLETKKKENFFESTVTEYTQSTAVKGWDSF